MLLGLQRINRHPARFLLLIAGAVLLVAAPLSILLVFMDFSDDGGAAKILEGLSQHRSRARLAGPVKHQRIWPPCGMGCHSSQEV